MGIDLIPNAIRNVRLQFLAPDQPDSESEVIVWSKPPESELSHENFNVPLNVKPPQARHPPKRDIRVCTRSSSSLPNYT